MELWTALLVGFFGSFHCVGMCGPIAMAIPRQSNRFWPLTGSALLYNVGRILTYTFIGLFFGFVGVGFTISGFQGALSIFLGVTIILGVSIKRYSTIPVPAFITGFSNWVTTTYGKLLRKESKFALVGLGVLNGLLPCPFVYTALAAAVLTNTPVHSAGYMALFGLGTFPAMYFMYLSPNLLSLKLRTSVRKAVPYFALALGILLIIRGLTLYDLFVAGTNERIETFCIFPGTEN